MSYIFSKIIKQNNFNVLKRNVSSERIYVGKKKQIFEYKIPIDFKTNRTFVLKEKLNYTPCGTFAHDIEKIKEKSISIVSNMTNKPKEVFEAEVYPKEIDNVQKIEKVQVSTTGKSFDWCSGCNELDAKYNDLDAKYNDLKEKFESSEEYPRILLALQDLNGYKRLEQISSCSESFKKKFKELHSHRILFAHYMLDEDKESTKIYKTLVLLRKLEGMSSKTKQKFCMRYGEKFLNEIIDYLKSLNLNLPAVPRNVKKNTEDFWDGF